MITKECLFCRVIINVKSPSRMERTKYCSHACRQKYRFFILKEFTMQRMWVKANTPESNAKKSHHREKHPLWKKDRKTKHRPRPESNDFKKSVFNRDGNKCIFCGSLEKLIADHIKPYALFPELRFDPSNGRTLCTPCHRKTETYGGKISSFKKMFKVE